MGSIAEEELEADPSLDELNGFRERIESLDRLDAYPLDWELSTLDCESVDARLYRRAKALYAQLQAANLKLYENLRSEIHRGACPNTLLQWTLNRLETASASLLEKAMTISMKW